MATPAVSLRATGRAAGLLPLPEDQPINARLAGAGSLRQELEALLAAAPEDASPAVFRELLMRENVAGKSSATARMWAWKRLKQ
jgi:hypothetical protein